jgi:tRNA uracil 4-sulfurtransferase
MPKEPDTIVLHYGEIALKSGNRLFFERTLLANARRLLEPVGISGLRNERGRIAGRVASGADRAAIAEAIKFLNGVVYANLAVSVGLDYGAIEKTVVEMMRGIRKGTFKIETVRADKRFPITSMEMSAKLGEAVINATGLQAKMRQPDTVCSVEITSGEAFVSVETIRGPGGLPTGSQSTVLVMLSGGIDSPVAALRLAKRGASIAAVHFHSYPITSRASLEKVKDLTKIIARPQGGMAVFMIPFADIQKATVTSAPPEFRVILYRRSMFRLAEALAKREGILALGTGESLGQVASQTVENIAAVSQAIHLPILRPLVGTDKEEIVTEARRYGTYDISIRPHEDCCSLFLPEHPETRARLDRVLEAEARIVRLDDLEVRALDGLDKLVI